MKKYLLVIYCFVIGITLVGCTIKNDKTVKEDNVTADVNTDIKDSALELTYKIFNESMVGEKVYTLGVITDIDLEGVKRDEPNFVLIQDAGDEVEEYLICCNMSVQEFNELDLVEGNPIKIYGTIKEESKAGIIVIQATLIDRGL